MVIEHDHLVLSHIPYVTPSRAVAYGRLISTLTLAGDITTTPDTHVVYFDGDVPCDRNGQPLHKVINNSGPYGLAPGLTARHLFSNKPTNGYPDYHAKMTTYVRILESQAQSIEPGATARTFPVLEPYDDDSVFRYMDTASTRAGIRAVSEKLRVGKVAIVGLGGTGAYVLDLLAKTPIGEIHLFDGDVFSQHNAFRAPGAASIEDLEEKLPKVGYLTRIYDSMRSQIISHEYYIDDTTVVELRDMDFVFLTMEGGSAKRKVVRTLERYSASFVDVGLGLYESSGSLAGVVRVTTSTPEQRLHVWDDRQRIPFGDDDGDNEYERNIQIADLNMLNAALAVIKWKKLVGFYTDLEREHFSTYTVDGNHITNEDYT